MTVTIIFCISGAEERYRITIYGVENTFMYILDAHVALVLFYHFLIVLFAKVMEGRFLYFVPCGVTIVGLF